jgi:hypothetical protein
MSPTTDAETDIVSFTAVGGMAQEISADTSVELLSLMIMVEFEINRAIPSGTTLNFCSIASPAKFPIAVT